MAEEMLQTTETAPARPAISTRPSTLFGLHLLAHLLLLLAALYSLVFATHFTLRFEQLRTLDHYRYQANGFRAWSLDFHTDDGRPMGPVLDSDNYKGKAYIPYGPLPTVFQFALDKVLGLNVSSPFIVWAILMATLYCLYWLAINFFSLIHGVPRHVAIPLAAAVCLAVATTYQFLHMALVPVAWSQAQVTGQLFEVLAIWVLLKYQRRSSLWLVALAGIFTACAGLSKQNYVFVAIPIGLFLVFERPEGPSLWARLKREGALFAAPVAAGTLVTLLWNYLRFDNPFETGMRFCNESAASPVFWARPQWHRIPLNFYNHFLAGVQVRFDDFPLLLGQSRGFGGLNRADGSGGLLHNIAMFSVFLTIPLLLVLLAYLPRILSRAFRRRPFSLADRWWCFLVATGASGFLILLALDSSWVRYEYDFLCCAMLAVFGTLVTLGDAVRRKGFRPYHLAAALGGCILLSLAFLWQTAVGIDQSLGVLASRTYRFLHWEAAERPSDVALSERAQMIRSALFDFVPAERNPIETEDESPAPSPSVVNRIWHVRKSDVYYRADGIRWIHVSGPLSGPSAMVRFPAVNRNPAEPLVVFGDQPFAADAVGIHYYAAPAGMRRVRFLLAHWGEGGACHSDLVDVFIDRPYRMVFHLDNTVAEAVVTLDGSKVIECGAPVYPSGWDNVHFGVNPVGFSIFAPEFSGAITPIPQR